MAATSPPPSPVAAPISPVRRIAELQQYLLYDVTAHEQVNKQRRALMFYLHLAAQLKRTLVLPRVRLLRRMKGDRVAFHPVAEYARYADLFNTSALSKLHPVIELDDFLKLPHDGPPISLLTRIDHQGCPDEGREH